MLLLVIEVVPRRGNDHEHEHEWEEKFLSSDAQRRGVLRIAERKDSIDMKLKERIEQMGAAGYILLWLLGIPIPVLFLFFLLRGCN